MLVKNEMVSMDWEAKGFIETKKLGFIEAVHNYNGVAVAFRDGKIYTMIDDEGNRATFDELVKDSKNAVKSKDPDYPTFYEDYAEVYDGAEFTSLVGYLGLENFKQDMLQRLEDLSGYWEITEVEM